MNFSLLEIFKRKSHLPLLVGDRPFTYSEVWEESRKTAYQFQEIGISKKDRVGLLIEQNENSLFHMLGLLMIGATPALISPKSSTSERAYFTQTAGLKTILKPETLKVEKLTPIENIETGIILFTSGSTGNPKALELSFDNLYYSAKGSIDFYKIGKEDKYLLNLPLNHIGGLMVFIRCLISGAQCILSQEDSILKHRPSIYSLVPAQLIRLLKNKELSSILKDSKAIIIGGDRLPEKYFDKTLPISLTYGLSESTAQVAASIPGTKEMKILPHREVLIRDNGQIGIKGTTKFKNYLIDGKKTSSDSIYWTQDIGTLKDGRLEVLGRLDDCFICGGENMVPAEIEKAFLNIDKIERVKVVPIRNEEYGHIPVAFYQADELVEDLKIKLKRYLPVYKIPKHIFKLEDLDIKWPKNKLIELAQRKIDVVTY